MKTERNRFFSYAPLSDKEKKNFAIFNLLRKKGSVSRTEIAKITTLKIVSVSNYVNNYINKKLVVEKGLDVSSGGRKPELVELNTQDNRLIGLDIGETEIKVLLTDLGINILEKAKVPASRTNYKYTLDAALDLVGEALKKSESGKNNIRAIGLGVSNVNFINIGQVCSFRKH